MRLLTRWGWFLLAALLAGVVALSSGGRSGNDGLDRGMRLPALHEPEARIPSAGGDQREPALVMTDGGFEVRWLEHGPHSGVFAQPFDLEGRLLAEVVQVSDTDSLPPAARSAPLAMGRLVVWENYSGAEASWDVLAQRLDPAGEPVLLCTECAGPQRLPTVATAADGSLLAVWQSEGAESEGWDIRARRFDPTGRPLGDDLRLNSNTAGDQTAPRVAAVGQGFVVVWQGTDPVTGLTSIFAKGAGGLIFADGFESGDASAWSAVATGPVASFIAVPVSGLVPLEVAFDGSASSDLSSTITGLAWDFGDGTFDSGTMVSHTYQDAGEFLAVLTVTSADGGTGSATAIIEAQAPNQPPNAVFTATPTQGGAPLVVSFDASFSSDPDGKVADWDWDFGDGEAAQGISASHTYAEAGTFDATLTVSDENGLSRDASLAINVLPGAPVVVPPPPLTDQTVVSLGGSSAPLVEIEITGGVQTVVGLADGVGNFVFDVELLANRRNNLFVTAIDAEGRRSTPVPIEIVHDAKPPALDIDFPVDGSEVTNAAVTVAGRVGDALSGFLGLEVRVDGEAAEVIVGGGTNGTFARTDVALDPGPNTVVVSAVDVLGNAVTGEIVITLIEPDGVRIDAVSGDGQIGNVGTLLAQPAVVRVLGAGGSPFADKLVTFAVSRSDGRLAETASGAGGTSLQIRTNANGEAAAYWTLGSDAGCANNRLTVTSSDVAGTVFLSASADPGLASRIHVGTGNAQRAEVGGLAPEPLRVWVNDAQNGIAGVEVTFTVLVGGGKVDGEDQVVAMTGLTGHAEVALVLGPQPGAQVIEADFAGNLGPPAMFFVDGIARNAEARTRFSARVVDNADRPLGGATCRLTVADHVLVETTSDGGECSFEDVLAGPGRIHVGGLSVTTAGAESVPEGSFPSLSFPLVLVPGTDNRLPTAVRLPTLNPGNARGYDGTADVELTIAGLEGVSMIVRAGSMRRADGSAPSPADPAVLALNPVHVDDLPMAMPDGAAPPFAWTLQPSEATFDPPVEVLLPNSSGLAAGSAGFLLSFDHLNERFEIVATGRVSDDGSVLRSDPGSGLRTAGWGGVCPPYPVTGDAKDCTPKANGCGPEGILGSLVADCFMVGGPNPAAELFRVCFDEPACGNHDRCYGTIGSTKSQCDQAFLADMVATCVAEFPGDKPTRENCELNARIYYRAVSAAGQSSYDQAQQETQFCLDMGQQFSPPATRAGSPVAIAGVTLEDADGDLLPDPWELEVGLDPSDPDDAEHDDDIDGLDNRGEYFARTDPFNPDTDGDDIGDAEEFAALQPPLPAVLDGTWSVTAGGRTVSAGLLGTFVIPNLSLPDTFGAGGPGTSPDGVGDDLLRVTGTSNARDTMRYATSECFRLVDGQSVQVGEIAISDKPPARVVAVTLTVEVLTLIALGQTTPLHAIALLGDGTSVEVTSVAACTSLRSSNPEIVTVNAAGVVTAIGAGTAFLTAVHEGATAVSRIIVSPGDPLTTVEGFVQDESGVFLDDVPVTLIEQELSAQTGAAGHFVFEDVATGVSESLTLTARAGSSQGLLFGVRSGILPVPGGVTDAGILVLDPSFDLPDRDGDGVADLLEELLGTDPASPDSDGDGTFDGEEDADGDGLADFAELLLGTDLLLPDSDGDGVLDGQEDSDGEGLTDGQELLLGTNPFDHDTDSDGFSDRDENDEGSDPRDASSLPPSLTSAQVLSVRNLAAPGLETGRAQGLAISVQNLVTPGSATGRAFALPVSVQNLAAPSGATGRAFALPFSLENQAIPQLVAGEADGLVISVENTGNL